LLINNKIVKLQYKHLLEQFRLRFGHVSRNISKVTLLEQINGYCGKHPEIICSVEETNVVNRLPDGNPTAIINSKKEVGQQHLSGKLQTSDNRKQIDSYESSDNVVTSVYILITSYPYQ